MQKSEFIKTKDFRKLQEIVKISAVLIENWDHAGSKKKLIDDILLFLKELDQKSPFYYLKGLSHKINESMALSDFNICLVPFKRELDRILYGDQFVVSHMDSVKNIKKKTCLYFILDNIRSAYNVGSMLRLAECVGVEEVFLTGYTANLLNPKVKKASMGSETYQRISSFDSASDLIRSLKSKNTFIVALETEKSAIDLYDFSCAKDQLAILVGNERHGISFDLLRLCDAIVKIPVWGLKNSLNVSIALSIASYEIRRKLYKA